MKKKNFLMSVLALTSVFTVGCTKNDVPSEPTILGIKDLVTEKFEFDYLPLEDRWDDRILDNPYTLDDYLTPSLTTEMLSYASTINFCAKENLQLIEARFTIVTKKTLLLKDAYYKVYGTKQNELSKYELAKVSVMNEPALKGNNVKYTNSVKINAGEPYEIVYTFNKHEKDTLSINKGLEFGLGYIFCELDGSDIIRSSGKLKDWSLFGLYNLQMTGYYR